MKKNYFLSFGLILFGAISLIFTSCEENKNEGGELADDVINIVEDDEIATTVFDDVFNDVMNEDESLGLKSAEMGIICREVDRVRSGDTIIKTITYNGECQFEIGKRVRNRSGQIIIKRINGGVKKEGAVKIVTFNDYYVDSVKIEGTKTIESSGLSADSMEIVLSINLEGGKLTFPDGTVVTRDTEKTRIWTVNGTWFDRGDDEYLVNGTSTGVNYKGESYTRTFIDLLWTPGCPFIRSGVVEILKDGETDPIVIDYGNGECDNKATISKDGQTKTIELKLKRRKKRLVR